MKEANIHIIAAMLSLFASVFGFIGIIACAFHSNYVGIFLYLSGFSVTMIFTVVKLLIVSNIIKRVYTDEH